MGGNALALLGRVVLAAGLLGLAALGFIHDDYALQWQAVPDDWPRGALAYANAAILAAGGLGILLPQTRRAAALAIAAFFLLWVIVFHAPRVAANVVAAWLGFFEILAISAGAFVLATMDSESKSVLGETGARIGRYVFAICPIAFGASHFIYRDFAATLMPAFFPLAIYWVLATGAFHIVGALGVLSGIQARLASLLLAVMFTGFALLYHIPRIVSSNGAREECDRAAQSL